MGEAVRKLDDAAVGPVETKSMPVAGFTEGLRKAELQKISNKLSKDGWELESYHDEGMSKSKATFRRSLSQESSPSKAKAKKWGWGRSFLVALFGSALLMAVHPALAISLSVLLLGLSIFSIVKKKLPKWDRHLAVISGLMLAFSVLASLGKVEEQRKREAFDVQVAEAKELVKQEKGQEALVKLDAALGTWKGPGQGEAQQLKSNLERATSLPEATAFVGDMKEDDFDRFVSFGELPTINKFSDANLNNIFKATVVGVKVKAVELRKNEIKRRAEEAKKQEAQRKLDAEAERKRQAEEKKKTAELAKQQALEKKIGRMPQNSGWDGSVRIVKRYLESNLKDPDSVQYIEWSPVSLIEVKGQKYWGVRVKYRAKNSFGGYVVEEKVALMQHDQVVAMVD